MKFKKGDKLEIKIEKIVYGGEGLGYYDGFAVFVPMSVPGDLVLVELISLKKTYGRGLIEKIITPGEERVDSDKITFEEFHGCDFAQLNYSAQLKYKTLMVEDVMKKIGKIENINILPILGAENPYNYRNKVIEPFATLNNKVITGFFRKRSHEVFQVEENFLNSILGNVIIQKFKELVNNLKFPVSVYNEENHKGILRHIMVRTNTKNEAMVVLVINGKKDDRKILDLLTKLKEEIKEIKSIYISLNKEITNFALGKENIHILGDKTLKENLFGIEFNISPTSFFQINIEQTKKLYSLALEFSEGIENQTMVDAYSGTGTIGMILAKKAKKVYAIEIVKSATEDGKQTAKENNIKNIEFINGAVEEKLSTLIKKEKIDGILLDPPRKGVDEESLKSIASTGINEIIYISCNPSTLARDAEVLTTAGYRLEKIQPVDMFPQTSHIECVARFVLKTLN
ncbi:MAG: 23S rRNA (uracil(1939)-C(5))-methyltransferase RlmD [Fusobacteriaceae bacterium]